MPAKPTVDELQAAIAADPALLQEIQADPVVGLRKSAEAAEKYQKETDPVI